MISSRPEVSGHQSSTLYTQIAEEVSIMEDVIYYAPRSDVVHPEPSGLRAQDMRAIGMQSFMCEPAGASNYTYSGRKTGVEVLRRPGRKVEPLSSRECNGGRKKTEKSSRPKDPIYFNKTRWWWYNEDEMKDEE